MPKGQLTTESRLRQQVTRLQTENNKLKNKLHALEQRLDCLEKENKELKLKLEDKETQRKVLLEKMYKPNKKEASGNKPGKKQGSQAYHRPKPKDEDVSEIIQCIPQKCPYCRSRNLGEEKEQIVKYTEDIMILPEKIIKKYIISKKWCFNCKEYVKSDKLPAYMPRIGPNVMAYTLYARYRLRLPIEKIQDSLKDLHGFKISQGEICRLLEDAKELFKSDYEAITELIKISDKIYCDETGWRVQGKNFWIWVFVTDKGIKYVLEDTRGKGVPLAHLGDNEDRTLISDFYAVYKNIPGRNQYCWVHLLRDSKATESIFHTELQSIFHILKQELQKPKDRRDKGNLTKMLDNISNKSYTDQNVQRVQTLQKRIRKTLSQLLTCMDYDVLPENNTAERALRNHVVMRKISGGSRSLKAGQAMAANTSVIDTLRKQNPDKGFFDLVLPKIQEATRNRQKEENPL